MSAPAGRGEADDWARRSASRRRGALAGGASARACQPGAGCRQRGRALRDEVVSLRLSKSLLQQSLEDAQVGPQLGCQLRRGAWPGRWSRPSGPAQGQLQHALRMTAACQAERTMLGHQLLSLQVSSLGP